MRIRQKTAVAVLAAAATVLGAPAFATAASTSTPGRQFLSDSAPVATASARFEVAALGWVGNPRVTNSEAVAAARPLVSALKTYEKELRSQRWPRKAATGIVSLATDCGRVVTDLALLRSVDLAKTALWEAPLLRDDVTMTAAANVVRRALGLPPYA